MPPIPIHPSQQEGTTTCRSTERGYRPKRYRGRRRWTDPIHTAARRRWQRQGGTCSSSCCCLVVGWSGGWWSGEWDEADRMTNVNLRTKARRIVVPVSPAPRVRLFYFEFRDNHKCLLTNSSHYSRPKEVAHAGSSFHPIHTETNAHKEQQAKLRRNS